jgi:DNA-binding FadR family transcriptional regulator
LKRLEVIHLRLAGQDPEALIQEIRDCVIRRDPKMIIRTYQHAAVETDIAIHIQMAEPSANPVDAELGVRLSTALREYGMVEHTLWMEQQGEATITEVF